MIWRCGGFGEAGVGEYSKGEGAGDVCAGGRAAGIQGRSGRLTSRWNWFTPFWTCKLIRA
jgi:hypothetical protein